MVIMISLIKFFSSFIKSSSRTSAEHLNPLEKPEENVASSLRVIDLFGKPIRKSEPQDRSPEIS